MLTVNLDIKICLTDDQTGNVSHIKFAKDSVRKVYVKFSDEQASLKAMGSSYLGRKIPGFVLKNVKPRFQ